MFNFLRRQKRETERQEVAQISRWLRAKARAKRMVVLGTMAVVILAGVYLAGVLTIIVGPRHCGNFRYGVICGESGITVTSTSQVCERTWLGLGPVRSYRQIVVGREEWIGDNFPYEATTQEELSLRPGDRVMRNNCGHFERLAPKNEPTKKEVAEDLPLPPPPTSEQDAFLSPENREKNIRELAKGRWDDTVRTIESHFHPVLPEVPEEEQVIYEGVPIKKALPNKIRLR